MEEINRENDNWMMDMTDGHIARILLKFSIPMLVGNIFQQIYNIVDSAIVGRYIGSKALGGVGSVGMISFLFFSLCLGLANGVGVIVANSFGNKAYEKIKK